MRREISIRIKSAILTSPILQSLFVFGALLTSIPHLLTIQRKANRTSKARTGQGRRRAQPDVSTHVPRISGYANLDAPTSTTALVPQPHLVISPALSLERGTCYLATGQDAKAETALTVALSQASFPRRRASILTDLAVLGTRQRDIAQLLDYATAAVGLAEQAGSPGYVGRKLHGLQAQLGSLLADTRIAQLNDRIARLPATT